MRIYAGTSHCVRRSVLNVERKILYMKRCFDLRRHGTPPHPQLRLSAVATVRYAYIVDFHLYDISEYSVLRTLYLVDYITSDY
jgi:hypothetical protein